MFSRKRSATTVRSKRVKAAGLSLVGGEMTIGGGVTSEGALHVDGRIEGPVRCVALCQGQSGVIAGDIFADEARIGGLVEGNVSARCVVIEASARIEGDVAYDTISIAPGAYVEGRLARRSALGETGDLLVATAAPPERETAEITLFSTQPTRIAVD